MSVSSGIPRACPEPRVTLTHDTPELAATYEEISIRQFENGKQLVSAFPAQPPPKIKARDNREVAIIFSFPFPGLLLALP
jgi:hypothetical protein